MAKFKQTDWELNANYDIKHSRHYTNGELMVLHCHHFTSLYTQLALDANELMNGAHHLEETAKHTFYETMMNYFNERAGLSLNEKINLVEQLYSVSGLGKMEITCAGDDSGEVTLHSSHVDAGWMKKWGPCMEPVNYITAGFIAAAFSAIFSKSIMAYSVLESASIVCGAEKSQFIVARV